MISGETNPLLTTRPPASVHAPRLPPLSPSSQKGLTNDAGSHIRKAALCCMGDRRRRFSLLQAEAVRKTRVSLLVSVLGLGLFLAVTLARQAANRPGTTTALAAADAASRVTFDATQSRLPHLVAFSDVQRLRRVPDADITRFILRHSVVLQFFVQGRRDFSTLSGLPSVVQASRATRS